MGFLDKLFGHSDPQPQPNYGQPALGQPGYDQPVQGGTGAFGMQPQGGFNQSANQRPQNADEQAIARYRYMLQTAPPEDIERAHEEAFSRLTPQQRQLVLQQLTQNISPAEAGRLSLDPRSLAQATTRAEVRQPGFIERTFGGGGQPGYGQQMQPGFSQQGFPQQGYAQPMGGMMGGGGGGGMLGGMGGMMAGGLLSSMAGSFIGSSIANSFFSHHGNEQAFQSSPEAQAVQGGVSDYAPADYADFQQGGGGLDASADPYGDPADAGNFQNAGYDTGAGTDPGTFDQGGGGLDASADPYGDPADAGGFDGGSDFGGGDF